MLIYPELSLHNAAPPATRRRPGVNNGAIISTQYADTFPVLISPIGGVKYTFHLLAKFKINYIIAT